IGAAGVTQNVSPASGLLDSMTVASSHRRTGPGIYRDAIAITQTRCHSRFAIAACDNFRLRPNRARQFQQYLAIFLRGAAGEKTPGAVHFAWQDAKNFSDLIRRR